MPSTNGSETRSTKQFLARACAIDLNELSIVWDEIIPQLSCEHYVNACKLKRLCIDRSAELFAWCDMPKRLRPRTVGKDG